MMKYTNIHNLPEPVVRAVRNDSYSKPSSAWSVTQLGTPPQLRALRRKHWGDLEEDVSEMLWALFGQAIHGVIERGGNADGWIPEVRLTHEVDRGDPMTAVTGQIDAYDADSATIWDWKSCSVWSMKDVAESGVGIAKPEWAWQANCYRWLAEREGWDVEEMRILAICRDHRQSEASRYNAWYPPTPFVPLEVPVIEDIEDRMRERIMEHMSADVSLELGEYQLYQDHPCSDEDRWSREGKHRVFRSPKHKRAYRVFDSLGEAESMAAGIKGAVVISEPTVHVRCERFCAVRDQCAQNNSLGL